MHEQSLLERAARAFADKASLDAGAPPATEQEIAGLLPYIRAAFDTFQKTTTPEQTAIVRWLRDEARAIRNIASMQLPIASPIILRDRAQQYDHAADAIERGEHLGISQ